MSKKRATVNNTNKSKISSVLESKVRELKMRHEVDRPDDPLLVPHLESLGLSTESMASPSEVYAALLESICGARDDSQPVEQYDGTLGVTTAFVTAHQSAACQVQWNNNLASVYTNPGNVSGERWGSGTMITNDLLLTCGHLFDQTGNGWERPRSNGTTNIISPQEIARNMRVNFNYQVDAAGNLRAEQSFAILELIEYRLGGLDMAICRVSGNPGATFGRTAVSSTDAASPDMICIIGHPAGLPKRIEAGPTTQISGNLIRYNDIDTLGGNSGSGILRASDGRLVGIHTNGGCNASSPGAGGSNFGQRIAAVIAASPTLRGLLAPTLKEAAKDIIKDIRKDGVKDLIKDSVKDGVFDPTRKELIKDPNSEPTFKEIRKDPVTEPTRKELIKDPVTEPFTFREGVFVPDPGTLGINPQINSQPVTPFVMASPSRAGGVEGAAGATNDPMTQMQELEQAIVAVEQQHAELLEAYATLTQMSNQI